MDFRVKPQNRFCPPNLLKQISHQNLKIELFCQTHKIYFVPKSWILEFPTNTIDQVFHKTKKMSFDANTTKMNFPVKTAKSSLSVKNAKVRDFHQTCKNQISRQNYKIGFLLLNYFSPKLQCCGFLLKRKIDFSPKISKLDFFLQNRKITF